MKEVKYRLGNQPKEYVLKEDYLGWIPENDEDWWQLCRQRAENMELTIVSSEDDSNKILFLHQFIIKDAFPLSFFGEERTRNWTDFAIVSDNETSEQFIIPLH